MVKWEPKQEMAGWVLLLALPTVGLLAALLALLISHPICFTIGGLLLSAGGLAWMLRRKTR
jgi:hypothetical protein